MNLPIANATAARPLRAALIIASPPTMRRTVTGSSSWDMLGGRLAPELGGDPRYLDIVGIHCHWSQQWHAAAITDSWVNPPRRGNAALVDLLDDVYARYRRSIVGSDTNRIAAGRAPWLRGLGAAIGVALGRGVPVIGAGVCRVAERPHPHHR